jgi:hypothetical protein
MKQCKRPSFITYQYFKVWWLCCSLLSHWIRNTEYHIFSYVYWLLHNICITDVQLYVPIVHNQVLSSLMTYHGIFKMGTISGAGFACSSAVVAFTRFFLRTRVASFCFWEAPARAVNTVTCRREEDHSVYP